MADLNRSWGSRFAVIDTPSRASTPTNPSDLSRSTTPSPIVSDLEGAVDMSGQGERTANAAKENEWTEVERRDGDRARAGNRNNVTENGENRERSASYGMRQNQDASIFVASLPTHLDDLQLKRELAELFLDLNTVGPANGPSTGDPAKANASKGRLQTVVGTVKIVHDKSGVPCAFVQVGSHAQASELLNYAFVHPVFFYGRVLRLERAKAYRALLVTLLEPFREDSSVKLTSQYGSRYIAVQQARSSQVAPPTPRADLPYALNGAGAIVSLSGPAKDTVAKLSEIFGPVESICESAGLPVPQAGPGNGENWRQPIKDYGNFVVKWESRNDCQSAYYALQQMANLRILWAHHVLPEYGAFNPFPTRPFANAPFNDRGGPLTAVPAQAAIPHVPIQNAGSNPHVPLQNAGAPHPETENGQAHSPDGVGLNDRDWPSLSASKSSSSSTQSWGPPNPTVGAAAVPIETTNPPSSSIEQTTASVHPPTEAFHAPTSKIPQTSTIHHPSSAAIKPLSSYIHPPSSAEVKPLPSSVLNPPTSTVATLVRPPSPSVATPEPVRPLAASTSSVPVSQQPALIPTPSHTDLFPTYHLRSPSKSDGDLSDLRKQMDEVEDSGIKSVSTSPSGSPEPLIVRVPGHDAVRVQDMPDVPKEAVEKRRGTPRVSEPLVVLPGQRDDLDPLSIFVGGLESSRWTDERLKGVFEPYGTVLEVKLFVGNLRKPGFGFVRYSDVEGPKRAIGEQDGQVYDGAEIRVTLRYTGQNRKRSRRNPSIESRDRRPGNAEATRSHGSAEIFTPQHLPAVVELAEVRLQEPETAIGDTSGPTESNIPAHIAAPAHKATEDTSEEKPREIALVREESLEEGHLRLAVGKEDERTSDAGTESVGPSRSINSASASAADIFTSSSSTGSRSSDKRSNSTSAQPSSYNVHPVPPFAMPYPYPPPHYMFNPAAGWYPYPYPPPYMPVPATAPYTAGQETPPAGYPPAGPQQWGHQQNGEATSGNVQSQHPPWMKQHETTSYTPYNPYPLTPPTSADSPLPQGGSRDGPTASQAPLRPTGFIQTDNTLVPIYPQDALNRYLVDHPTAADPRRPQAHHQPWGQRGALPHTQSQWSMPQVSPLHQIPSVNPRTPATGFPREQARQQTPPSNVHMSSMNLAATLGVNPMSAQVHGPPLGGMMPYPSFGYAYGYPNPSAPYMPHYQNAGATGTTWSYATPGSQ